MKKFVYAAFALIQATGLAAGADKLSLKLSPNEMFVIVRDGLNNLDGSMHIVNDARGESSAVMVPFKLRQARLTIAHDKSIIDRRIAEFQIASASLDQKEKNRLAEEKTDVDGLLSLTVDDLRLDENDIVASTLAALAPICPSCVVKDAPKSDKK